MFAYLIRRLAYSLFLLIGVSGLLFFAVRFTPGNPYDRIRQEMADRNPRQLASVPQSHWERLDALLGIDKPLPEQFVRWMGGVLTGRFGESWALASGKDALGIIWQRAPYTVSLMLAAALLAGLVSLPLGLLAASHQYSNLDHFITAGCYFGIAMPGYLIGLALVALFSTALDWLPMGGVVSRELTSYGDFTTALAHLLTLGRAYPESAGHVGQLLLDGARHLLLPAITVSVLLIARWTRFVRVAMLEVMGNDYIRAARGRGIPEWLVITKHGLRNGLAPLVTTAALDVPALFIGAFIVEVIFSWPGIARLYMDGLRVADWPVLQGILIFSAVLFVLSNLAADIAYRLLDPRIADAG